MKKKKKKNPNKHFQTSLKRLPYLLTEQLHFFFNNNISIQRDNVMEFQWAPC